MKMAVCVCVCMRWTNNKYTNIWTDELFVDLTNVHSYFCVYGAYRFIIIFLLHLFTSAPYVWHAATPWGLEPSHKNNLVGSFLGLTTRRAVLKVIHTHGGFLNCFKDHTYVDLIANAP